MKFLRNGRECEYNQKKIEGVQRPPEKTGDDSSAVAIFRRRDSRRTDMFALTEWIHRCVHVIHSSRWHILQKNTAHSKGRDVLTQALGHRAKEITNIPSYGGGRDCSPATSQTDSPESFSFAESPEDYFISIFQKFPLLSARQRNWILAARR